MYPLGAAGQVLISRSHTMATRVQVLHGGRPVHELSVYQPADQATDRGRVMACEVTADADQPILRDLSLSLIDPDGDLSLTDAGELLSPYDAEIKPWSGVLLPSGIADMVPHGVFALTGAKVSDGPRGVTVDLKGLDRAKTYRVPLPGPVTIKFGTPVEQAIGLILSRVRGDFTWTPWQTGVTVGPLLFDSDDEAWDTALTLAESVGGWLRHNRDGKCELSPWLNTTTTSTQRFAETLLSVEKDEDSDTIHNSVVVQSSNTGVGLIRVTVEDTDPKSPTWVLGRYRRRQMTITNPHITTYAQARETGRAELVRELGRSGTITWTCPPDPQTDPGDVPTVHLLPRYNNRRVVVARTSYPLDVQGVMTVTGRRSVIAQDGGTL